LAHVSKNPGCRLPRPLRELEFTKNGSTAQHGLDTIQLSSYEKIRFE